jgi:hypothetical protein
MILKGVPADLIDGLDPEDRQIILEQVGKPVKFIEIRDVDGRAEVEFVDRHGKLNWIWVETKWLDGIDC